jgi:hypothetical protein
MAKSTVRDDLNAALSEQRGALMTAKTLEADLDLAYHLQMQEAMTASLALRPTSSSCSSPPQPEAAVSSPKDAVLDVAATLMLQDVERFVQEHEDRELSEAEMRKMREDLDRRIHDQKLADDILNIPEEEWEADGDNYHRPYRTDSSSSSSTTALVDTERFRLYFKGLVSEERIRDMKVTVAGAGVAICDRRDGLILEARKNLEAFVDGQVVTDEVAELEALIEGLNKALSLNLKRLTFFCDDNGLYQYVSP